MRKNRQSENINRKRKKDRWTKKRKQLTKRKRRQTDKKKKTDRQLRKIIVHGLSFCTIDLGIQC